MGERTSPSLNIVAGMSDLALMEQQTTHSSTNVPENLLCKNRLQELAQKSGLPLPIYQTINEGAQHEPMFRSTVFVDGTYIRSPNAFPSRKAAEQDVASVALASLTQKIKDEGYPIIREDTVFCKSILNEYATKMNLEFPTYTTIQPHGSLPVFISSLVFNGVNYTGEAGRTKKEAEQLAARAVILSIFGNSESGTVILEIIKSKFRLYNALHEVKNSHFSQNSNTPLAPNMAAVFTFPFRSEEEVESTGKGNAPLVVNTRIPFGNEKEVDSTGNGSVPLVVNAGLPFGNEKGVASTANGNAPLVVSPGVPSGNGKEVGITQGAHKGTSTVGNAPLVVNTGIPFGNEREFESTGNGSVPLVVNTGLPFGNEKGVVSTGNGNAPLVVSTGIPSGNEREVGITQGAHKGTSTTANAPLVVNTGIPFRNEKEVVITRGANQVTSTAITEAFASQLTDILAMQRRFHECKKPKCEPSPVAFTRTAFAPPAMEQTLGVGPSSVKKRNRKNKKKKKQLQVDAQFRPFQIACSAALNQAHSC